MATTIMSADSIYRLIVVAMVTRVFYRKTLQGFVTLMQGYHSVKQLSQFVIYHFDPFWSLHRIAIIRS
jgi:hypothetical protein